MLEQTIEFNGTPSEENIRLEPLAVHCSIIGEGSSGSAAGVEIIVPGAQRPAAPVHTRDHCEETICGIDGVLA